MKMSRSFLNRLVSGCSLKTTCECKCQVDKKRCCWSSNKEECKCEYQRGRKFVADRKSIFGIRLAFWKSDLKTIIKAIYFWIYAIPYILIFFFENYEENYDYFYSFFRFFYFLLFVKCKSNCVKNRWNSADDFNDMLFAPICYYCECEVRFQKNYNIFLFLFYLLVFIPCFIDLILGILAFIWMFVWGYTTFVFWFYVFMALFAFILERFG